MKNTTLLLTTLAALLLATPGLFAAYTSNYGTSTGTFGVGDEFKNKYGQDFDKTAYGNYQQSQSQRNPNLKTNPQNKYDDSMDTQVSAPESLKQKNEFGVRTPDKTLSQQTNPVTKTGTTYQGTQAGTQYAPNQAYNIADQSYNYGSPYSSANATGTGTGTK